MNPKQDVTGGDPTRKEVESILKNGGSSKLEDCKEAQDISPDLKQVSGKETSYKGLPTIGKWIKWDTGTFKAKAWVREYTDDVETPATKGVTVENMNGVYVHVITDQDDWDWSYCETPGKEEKENAEWEGLNEKIGDRFCNTCKCVTKKLQICTGCYKVYYCDASCQMGNWDSHKADCKQEKTVLKPDPRYPLSIPLSIPALNVKKHQVRTQNRNHQILHDALNGNFTVERRGGEAIRNPKAGLDLEFGKDYELKVNNKELAIEQFNFVWEGSSTDHSIPEGNPTSCIMFYYMESYLKDEEFMKGGLHYLAGSYQEIEIFWFMLINFNTFGTVAPHYGPCTCNPKNVKAQMPPERRELRKKWNKFFKRAKADINDVQCMYSNSEEGCHNYNNCPYKHDVEVKKEKKKKLL